jgi:hypothetical protein
MVFGNKKSRRILETIESLARKPGLRSKIDANFCKYIYDPYQSEAWRNQVSNCTGIRCSLYAYVQRLIVKVRGNYV